MIIEIVRCIYIMGSKITEKVLIICQPEKILFLLERGLVSQLYGIVEKYPHKKQKNGSSQAVV